MLYRGDGDVRWWRSDGSETGGDVACVRVRVGGQGVHAPGLVKMGFMAVDVRYETRDPVVVYDRMREAGNQLIARYAVTSALRPLSSENVAAIRAIRAEMMAVPAGDIDAQRLLTQSFKERAALA